MATNKLKANDNKTALLIIRRTKSNESETFQIGNEIVKENTTEKLLGVTVTNDLKWDEHIKKLVAKLKFRLFNLRRLSKQLPNNLLKRVADAIFMSHVRYGLSLYCSIEIEPNDPHSNSIEKLRTVFNDCLRLLSGKSRSDHESIKKHA